MCQYLFPHQVVTCKPQSVLAIVQITWGYFLFLSAFCFFQIIANAVWLCSDMSIQGGFKSLDYLISILIVRDLFAFLIDSSAQSFAGGPYVFLKRFAKFPWDNPATSYRPHGCGQSLFQVFDWL